MVHTLQIHVADCKPPTCLFCISAMYLHVKFMCILHMPN